ncbi:MAG: hypothetical protein JWM07_457 [Candidatus Saccharibacteria bacterium]|nr:hypothetical protein [Candidatus Saccharibacteria bacterium]
MTDTKLIKLEKEIQKKITVPEQKKTGSNRFVVDVDKLKRLAKRLNDYEAQSHVTAQR